MEILRLRAPLVALLVSLGLSSGDALALEPGKAVTQYIHQVWETEDGLPQNSVSAILQTRDGYIWIGTQEGLVRFDGVRFTVFDTRNSPGLKTNFISVLLQDAEGTLWVGTDGGGLSRLRDGAFTAYTKEQGLASNVVCSIHQDRAGTLWIGTRGGLNRFRDGKFTAYTTREGLSNDVVLAISEDREGSLWVGTDGGGLNRFRDDRFTTYTRRDGLSHDIVSSIHAGRDGSLWIGTWGGGLNRLKEGKFTAYTNQSALSSGIVSAIFEDRHGNLWIGTDGAGLYRLRGETIDAYTAKEGLSSDLVRCIQEDSEGSLWIGTRGGGLNRLKDGRFTTYTRREGLSDNMVRAIYQDRAGAVWIGTDGGGLNRFADGRFTVFTKKDGLPHDNVRAISQGSDGTLWFGTWGGGLARFRDGKFTSYTTKDGLLNDIVWDIEEDSRGDLWIGTNGGLNRLKDGRFDAFTTKTGLPHDVVKCLYEASDGSLWIGTDGGGLIRFRDERFTAYTTKNGLSNDIIRCIHQDREGTLWIGTRDGGLNRFRDGRFVAYRRTDGLFDDAIFQILEDDADNLWMSSNNGIFRVRKKELDDFAEGKLRRVTSLSYGKADGMGSSECNGGAQPAGWKTRDGKLWFPTIKGTVVVDTNYSQLNQLRPPVWIERVTAGKEALTPRRRARLSPGTRTLEFQYTALSFLEPSKVRFRYRLEGFDKEWIEAGTRRVAYYTNIPPGKYAFRVTACNNDGLWNQAGASFEFSLPPHFYESYWFYGLILFGVVVAAVGGYRRRVITLTTRKYELIRLVGERTRQLEQANEQLERANRLLRRLSAVDGMTGVANRRQFDEALELEWRRTYRGNAPLSLILADIDFFKAYNDAYGHQKGDDCLKQVASALSEHLNRPGDLVARYGGEEFAVILPETDARGAIAIAERLRQGVEELAIPHRDSAAGRVVTVSFGVASTLPREHVSAHTLIAAADQALYKAKREGRNQVRLAEATETNEKAASVLGRVAGLEERRS